MNAKQFAARVMLCMRGRAPSRGRATRADAREVVALSTPLCNGPANRLQPEAMPETHDMLANTGKNGSWANDEGGQLGRAREHAEAQGLGAHAAGA